MAIRMTLPRLGLTQIPLLGRMSAQERLSALLAAMAIFSVLFLPVWWIHLRAGQYPEGLILTISARDVTGDLQSINILNHYIGMKPVDSRSFSEFAWLTPVLATFAGLALISSLVGRRLFALITWFGFLAFMVVMMVDMHHWLYVWGHELDPRAAFRVAPFQPPLLGFKQIANFGVWSLPSWGGILLMVAALLGPLGILWEMRKPKIDKAPNLGEKNL